MATEKFKFKAGLFGIGLETYWQQFPGLKSKLQSNLDVISERICEFDAEIAPS
jgi:L-arabinose isomerase